jgi:hypothetical protein
MRKPSRLKIINPIKNFTEKLFKHLHPYLALGYAAIFLPSKII